MRGSGPYVGITESVRPDATGNASALVFLEGSTDKAVFASKASSPELRRYPVTRYAIWILMAANVCCQSASAAAPAKRLFLANLARAEIAVFAIERPSAKLVTAKFEPGERRAYELAETSDDRVVVATRFGSAPYKVLAVSHFSASQIGTSTIEAALVEDQQVYYIVYYTRGGGEGPKPIFAAELSRRLIQANKDAILRAKDVPTARDEGW